MPIHLLDLPTEILSLIVGHLDQHDLYHCILVLNSKLYNSAAPFLWRTVQRPQHGLRFLDCLFGAQHIMGSWIRHVHLQDLEWTDDTLLLLMRQTPFLSSLVLDNASQVTDTSLRHLARYCPHIESLHLFASPITSISFQVFGQQCSQLTNLELWNCPNLHQNTFSIYFVGSPLKKLTLATWIITDDNDILQQQINETVIDLAGLHQLTYLKIHGPSFNMLHQSLTDNNGGGGAIFGLLSNLTCLEIEACFDMLDHDLIPLICRLPNSLTHLTLMDGQFTDLTLDTIALSLPHLVALDVSCNDSITPGGIRRLIRRCPCLALVTVSYCGMSMMDFPEAGPQCQGTVIMFHTTIIALHHLDHHAINAIRCHSFDTTTTDDDKKQIVSYD